ncbi:MAG: gamma-glutamyltransferase [Flavobacteriaceae bacterium]|nr:gamma-glutamyltransferase [Flavobacteriaceae bacterium]OUX40369.1 MAG: gamma-glutamyltransferase [Flavobacteriaceae bacterium TMED265]
MTSLQSISAFIIVLFIASCSPNTQQQKGLATENAMVVSARIEASSIGAELMKKGGNAFDAMVATEMALAVTFPFAGNLAGGGFMVYRLEDGSVGSIDYREKAPLQASEDMYLDEEGNVIPGMSTTGAMAIGVPGTVDGILQVNEKFGTLALEDILVPVIALAQKGFVVTKKQETRLKYYDSILTAVNGKPLKEFSGKKEGDTIKRLSLANTLKSISQNNRDGFYAGEVAQKMITFIQEKGGVLTLEDLELYRAKWRNPVQFNYENLNIISMGPPSSGGMTMAQIFKMIEPYNIGQYEHNKTEYIQLLTESFRRAYADRNYYLGDPDFVDIPTEKLLDSSYLDKRMSNFSFDKATISSSIKNGEMNNYESDETTHYSIVDQFGNAVSVTTTINGGYGSKLYSEELGLFFNNEMDDFSAKPGVPNMFGLIGAEANKIQPQKRMLSSMTPTIVEKDNELFMVVGTPGGSTIITAVTQTILNIHEFDMSMQEAVNANRFHHQWLPDMVTFEPNGFDDATLEELTIKGYVHNKGYTRIIGKVDAIKVLPSGLLEGGADPRGDDTAIGF